MAIGCYFIRAVSIYFIGAYEWLLVDILLMAISSYFVGGC
jgi:hypothetical protein